MGQSAFLTTDGDQQEKKTDGVKAAPDDQQAHEQREAALRARINAGIVEMTNKRSGAPGDCFTYAVADHAFLGLTSDNKNAFYAVPKIFQGRDAAQQMAALAERAGPLLSGDQVTPDSLREGMVVGIGSGKPGASGVDDVRRTGVVYRDPATHELMFAETKADGRIEKRTVAQLVSDAHAYNKNLFAGDLTTLAETMGARPRDGHAPAKNVTGHKDSIFAPEQPASDPLAVIRAQLSNGIEATVNNAMRAGTRYHMGSNNSRFVDCSNFVGRAADAAFRNLVHDGRPVHGAPSAAHNISENQIDNISRQTGVLLQGRDVTAANLREGMVIGIDTGEHSWDGGRRRGIDHIVAVYRDSHTGHLMVAESTGCRDPHTGHTGPRTMELDAWLSRAHRIWGSRLHMYATDLAVMADRMGYAAPGEQPQTQLAQTPAAPAPQRPQTAPSA